MMLRGTAMTCVSSYQWSPAISALAFLSLPRTAAINDHGQTVDTAKSMALGTSGESDTAAGGEVTGGDALMIATGDALDDQIHASRTHKCLSWKDPLDHSDRAHTNQESPLHRSLHSQHCTRRHIRRRRHR